MKFSKYTFKAVTPVMALFQKQHQLPFKQGYDNLRSTRGESAASADTAQSERCFHRNQSAVCASHNVPSDTHYSVKVVPVLLSNAGIEENHAWDRALENLSADTQITNLGKVLSDLMGAPYDSSMDANTRFHVITNKQKFKGAAAIMNRNALKSFTQKYRTNMLFVLPSSIHEMMIAPYDSSLNLDELSAMVKEINETQVAPEERLTDRAYIITL